MRVRVSERGRRASSNLEYRAVPSTCYAVPHLGFPAHRAETAGHVDGVDGDGVDKVDGCLCDMYIHPSFCPFFLPFPY